MKTTNCNLKLDKITKDQTRKKKMSYKYTPEESLQKLHIGDVLLLPEAKKSLIPGPASSRFSQQVERQKQWTMDVVVRDHTFNGASDGQSTSATFAVPELGDKETAAFLTKAVKAAMTYYAVPAGATRHQLRVGSIVEIPITGISGSFVTHTIVNTVYQSPAVSMRVYSVTGKEGPAVPNKFIQGMFSTQPVKGSAGQSQYHNVRLDRKIEDGTSYEGIVSHLVGKYEDENDSASRQVYSKEGNREFRIDLGGKAVSSGSKKSSPTITVKVTNVTNDEPTGIEVLSGLVIDVVRRLVPIETGDEEIKSLEVTVASSGWTVRPEGYATLQYDAAGSVFAHGKADSAIWEKSHFAKMLQDALGKTKKKATKKKAGKASSKNLGTAKKAKSTGYVKTKKGGSKKKKSAAGGRLSKKKTVIKRVAGKAASRLSSVLIGGSKKVKKSGKSSGKLRKTTTTKKLKKKAAKAGGMITTRVKLVGARKQPKRAGQKLRKAPKSKIVKHLR